ncbi:MAG: serine/threonine protein kinase, partial [Planctomycetes bacterium]|nr:serine/threonine protein kinase [Planctomycetota bacterium]
VDERGAGARASLASPPPLLADLTGRGLISAVAADAAASLRREAMERRAAVAPGRGLTATPAPTAAPMRTPAATPTPRPTSTPTPAMASPTPTRSPAPAARAPVVGVTGTGAGSTTTTAAADAGVVVTAAEPAPGRRFGDYQVQRELGRGAMGIVYLATHVPSNREVALKVMPSSLLLSETDLARFEREARAAALLSHRSIVPVYDSGAVDGVRYIAMGVVNGETLRAVIDRGRIAPDRAARLVFKAAEGVWHAHQRGVIHRDIKPANIMVTRDDEVFIVDFGLAFEKEDATLTTTGSLVGTPMYMAPERLLGSRAQVGPGCDIYSLGATLFETVSGQPPFDGDDNYDIIRRILYERPRDIRAIYPGVPPRIVGIIEKAMAREVAERYPTAYEMAQDLQRFALQMKIDRLDTLRASRAPKKRR